MEQGGEEGRVCSQLDMENTGEGSAQHVDRTVPPTIDEKYNRREATERLVQHGVGASSFGVYGNNDAISTSQQEQNKEVDNNEVTNVISASAQQHNNEMMMAHQREDLSLEEDWMASIIVEDMEPLEIGSFHERPSFNQADEPRGDPSQPTNDQLYSFWEYAENVDGGRMRCKFCGDEFAKYTSISRIKFHLAGVKGRGVRVCEQVPQDVQEAALAAIDGPPKKKHKAGAGSTNKEVTNAISASAQQQRNEMMMAHQREDLSLEDWMASITVEDMERGSFHERPSFNKADEPRGDPSQPTNDQFCSPSVNNDVSVNDAQNIVGVRTEQNTEVDNVPVVDTMAHAPGRSVEEYMRSLEACLLEDSIDNGLKVLDLYRTNIECLPDSVSDLDFSRSNQHMDNEKPNVFINGKPIPDRLVKRAEKLAGPIQPGDYWYDVRAGFWGVTGKPCAGIIPPSIEEFNYPMPENCAAGNTGVFVNGRELHQKDLDRLSTRGLPITRQKFYIVEVSGRVFDEDTGEELDRLGRLAPTVEKAKRGFGMKVPMNEMEPLERGSFHERPSFNQADEPRGDPSQPTNDQLCSPSVNNDVIMNDAQNVVGVRTEPVVQQSNAELDNLSVDAGRTQVGVQGMEQGGEEGRFCSHLDMENTGEGSVQHVDRIVPPTIDENYNRREATERLVQPDVCSSAFVFYGNHNAISTSQQENVAGDEETTPAAATRDHTPGRYFEEFSRWTMEDDEDEEPGEDEELLDPGRKRMAQLKLGWTLLMTSIILEIASAVFDQMGYALVGMVLAFVALPLATAELLIHTAGKERRSLLPISLRPSTATFVPGKPAGTIVEYFGLLGAVWQCVYSTVAYAYARQNKANPIKMSLLPLIFFSCVVISKLNEQSSLTRVLRKGIFLTPKKPLYFC